ncbi:methylated-DNA--[protein]-cysteine S-methyltransferase [Candidatus Wolfebacteria bacterium]|nr:methylated-DNA--[protein]-cysteine S-methyltransferase [Candidatus Wolfebacteria bacterium]
MDFREKVFKIVSHISKGNFLTYKKVAELVGEPKAYRAIGNILAKNRNIKIPCYRVIRNDNLVGGFYGDKNLDWQKTARLLKDGVMGVIPTDTIYGICASALNKKSVEKVYKLRKRNPKKPMIILISSFDDLKLFGVGIDKKRKAILKKFWLQGKRLRKISVILKCPLKKFAYLHRETKTLAFRLSKNKELIKILKISGPLVAPSANWEGYKPAQNISQAKKYFGGKVFYFDKGKIISKPSMLVDLTSLPPKILRS